MSKASAGLEAMKMIMPVKAMASGKIEHTRGAGSIVAAGELLGQLQLDDPSSVQKIVAFEGQIAPTVVSEGDTGAEADIRTQVDLAMDGFARMPGSEGRVQVCFSKTSLLNQADLACEIFDRYLAVEEKFAALVEARRSPRVCFRKVCCVHRAFSQSSLLWSASARCLGIWAATSFGTPLGTCKSTWPQETWNGTRCPFSKVCCR